MIRVRGPASPYDPSYHLLLNTRKIRDVIAREHPDVLEIHSPYMAAVGALRAKPSTFGIRTFQWHSDFIDTYGGVLEDKVAALLPPASANAIGPLVRSMTRPLWSLVRTIARRCDATLVASKWQVDKLREHGVTNVIHRSFGIERSIFHSGARSLAVRHKLLSLVSRDATSRSQILVGVGRFAIEKRWDVVIDTFMTLRAKGRDVVLILFGDGPERVRMAARVASAHGGAFAGDVALPGFTKDRHELAGNLASADVLIHGCPFETFGLSIAEALSCGLPCVVPDDGGAAEMHDPASGERYRATNVSAFVAAVERLLVRVEVDPDALRAAAVATAAKLPSVERHFEEQIALYQELLDRRR